MIIIYTDNEKKPELKYYLHHSNIRDMDDIRLYIIDYIVTILKSIHK